MSYSVSIFGEITFPKGTRRKWLASPVDPNRYDDWPATFARKPLSSWAGKSKPPPAISEFIDDVNRFDREGSFIAIKTKGETVTLRALLEKSEYATFKAHLVTAFRCAADFGATGEIAVVAWSDSPEDFGYSGALGSKLTEAKGRTLAKLRASAGYREVKKRVDELVKKIAREARFGPDPLSPEVLVIWSRVLGELAKRAPDAVVEGARRAGVIAVPKQGIARSIADIFSDGAELCAAFEAKGSPRLYRMLSGDFYADALPTLAAIDADVAHRLARDLLAVGSLPDALVGAAMSALAIDTGDAELRVLLDALRARAVHPNDRPNAFMNALGAYQASAPSRALVDTKHARADDAILAELRGVIGERRPFAPLEPIAQMRALALASILAHRRAPAIASIVKEMAAAHPDELVQRSAAGIAART